MRVALLAGAGSIHTIRWANGLAEAGANVHLLTQHPFLEPVDDKVGISRFPYRGNAGYFMMAPAVRRRLQDIRPDILSVHYASGYGTTAKLVGFHPYVLSVWGADVYDFPMRSPLHRWWLRTNLEAADRIASTSHVMAEQAGCISSRLGDIAITPFGVDVSAFGGVSGEVKEGRGARDFITVGTVKTLAPKYGIDTLIRAFAELRTRLKWESPVRGERLRLRIVGDGPERNALEGLAVSLRIADVVKFVGRVAHREVPRELGKFDIYAALSRFDSESFGVAVVEAAASRLPVVVSDAGGLPEVVRDGETGFVVPRDNPQAAAAALKRLVLDGELRERVGNAAYAHVSEKYSWRASVDRMLTTLEQTKKQAKEHS